MQRVLGWVQVHKDAEPGSGNGLSLVCPCKCLTCLFPGAPLPWFGGLGSKAYLAQLAVVSTLASHLSDNGMEVWRHINSDILCVPFGLWQTGFLSMYSVWFWNGNPSINYNSFSVGSRTEGGMLQVCCHYSKSLFVQKAVQAGRRLPKAIFAQ